MRTIKFRAWDKVFKGMHDVSQLKWWSGLDEINCHNLIFKPYEVELMQYTGIKDKNNKEIFEGDILHSDNPDSEGNCIVKWEDDGFVANSLDYTHVGSSFFHEFEVIGNIYENEI